MRKRLPARRRSITQKAKIAGDTSVYLTVNQEGGPVEFFINLKGPAITPEIVGLCNTIARLASLALQFGVPLQKIGETLMGMKFDPAGVVAGDPHIKSCTSIPDYLGRHLLTQHCGYEELKQAK